MPEQSVCTVALLLEMAGLFAIWNWSRRTRTFAWMLLGSAILFLFAGLIGLLHNPFGERIYAAFAGMYLFSGLMWAWWLEGVRPVTWRVGEWFVALAAACLFGLASSAL
jgi:small multidrug resistance family-3 protein